MQSLSKATLSVLIAVLLTATAGALADDERSGSARLFGKTYGEWAARWWQWAYAGPDGRNVLQDATGAFCSDNQPDRHVWFLAGTFGGRLERSCTVPAGRALFYSPLNTLWTDCNAAETAANPENKVRELLAAAMEDAGACAVRSTLDDVPIVQLQVPMVRAQSPRFTTTLPANDLAGPRSGCGGPLGPGRSPRQIADGYWIMLPPLRPGLHTLKAYGESCVPGAEFISDVTYHLTVVGSKRE